ncbi:MAG: DNA primase, partial [Clostridia bacterium]|nr:DNA primase [Clostridia bacterium]
IKFVRELENIDFMDAVKLLADKAGLQLPQTGFDNQKTVELKRKRDAILKIMNDCAHFYLDNLNSGKAEAHIEYILKRKIPSNIVRTFGLGASLNYTDLPKFLLSKGYSKQDIIDSGAVNEVDGRLVDAQGGRLIYPVINAMDEVVAFGGRVLKKTEFAKYKNTKETLIFNKSKTLYNINLLKRLRKTQTIKEVIMVEGYMDTISLYQAGFKNVVASMGTSLTQEQARLVKRYADTVLISYDGDGAGQKANMRGLEILKSEGLNVKVVPLPEGLDPDDVIKQRGVEGYQKCLDTAMPLIDYKLKSVGRGLDVTKTEDKRRYVSEAIKVIKTADSAAEQEELLKQLRDSTGITYESLKRDLSALPEQTKTEPVKETVRKDLSSVTVKASRFVIAAYLFGAKYAQDKDITEIPFDNDVHTIIAKYLGSKKLLDEKVQTSELFEFFEEKTPEYDELCKILDLNDGNTLSNETSERYFDDCILKLRLNFLDGQIAALKTLCESESDVNKRKKNALRLQELIKQKEKLKSGEK